jgi:ADP-ribose pyrophosphatase YjhB (NUDIX family)
MTSQPVILARTLLYGGFYRLPSRWRRRLARLGSVKYILGAVVLVRNDAGDRMVLLRQPPGRAWSLPAGLLKRGEPPVVGAARELYEETGIKVAPEDLVPGEPNAVVHHVGRWVDVVFHARIPGDHPLVVDGAEVLEAAWYRLDELPTLTRPTAYLLGCYGIGPGEPGGDE